MSDGNRLRKRAVRLTPGALEDLRTALHERWRQDHASGKLTRETRADLLGVSVATSERILSGKGVDRPTLTLAYKNLGLTWDDRCCELAHPPVKDASLDQATEVPVLAVNETPRAMPRRLVVRALAGVLVAGMVLTIGWLNFRANSDSDVNLFLNQGFAEFHSGNYEASSKLLLKAIAVARDIRDAGALSTALRMDGDLAMAQGQFERAANRYADSRTFMVEMGMDRNIPALDEALGDVHTKLGNYLQAKDHLMRSLEGFRSYKDNVGVAMVSRDLGTLAFRQSDYRAAHQWFETSLKTTRGLNKPDIETDVMARSALVLRDQGRLEDARQQLKTCLEYWRGRKHARWIAVTEFQLGTVEVIAGNPEATAILTSARQGFEAVGDKAGAAEARSWLEKARLAINALPNDPIGIPKQQKDAGLRR